MSTKTNRIIIALTMIILLTVGVVLLSSGSSAVMVANADIDINETIGQYIGIESSSVPRITEQVYLGGFPLGMTIDGNGVTVVGINEFIEENGHVVSPALDSGIKIGDTILSIDELPINNSTELSNIAIKSQGRILTIRYMRNGEELFTTIQPQKDLKNKQYKLGLWTKDSSSGIGTMTFWKQDLRFASLGHPICDNKGNVIVTHGGGVYHGIINGVKKGVKGCAGELNGTFDITNNIGSIDVNGKYGVYGNLSRMPDLESNLYNVASINEVKPGKATIYTTLDNNIRKSYDIEIVKVCRQKVKDDKGMIIRITDEDLLDKAGGIVQGMSGSPIVQNGKLVGAVTHVFINDPTRGYGMFAQWMLDN